MLSNPLSDLDFGWLIGILEGEGYFGYEMSNRGWSHRIGLGMTDQDTVLKTAALIMRVTGKMPHIYMEHPGKNNVQEIYRFRIHGKEARQIMRLIVEHMSWRRRQKIWQCLNCWKPRPEDKLTTDEILQLVVNNG